MFATEKEAKAILEYGKEKYKDSDYANVEEKIAEDFIKYAKDRSGFTGSIRKLFDSIIDRIKQFFGNGDKIQKMYRDIMGGKAKKVDLGIKPKEEKFRTDITPKITPKDSKLEFKEKPYLGSSSTKNGGFLKLMEDGKEVGSIEFVMKHHEQGRRAILHTMEINEGLRGKGLGTKFFDKFVSEVIARGGTQIKAVTVTNPEYWKKLGFRDAGEGNTSMIYDIPKIKPRK